MNSNCIKLSMPWITLNYLLQQNMGKCICCTGEMCWSLLFGQVFLNLGSGNFKSHNEMARFNSDMKEGVLKVTMWRCGMDPNHTDLQVLRLRGWRLKLSVLKLVCVFFCVWMCVIRVEVCSISEVILLLIILK